MWRLVDGLDLSQKMDMEICKISYHPGMELLIVYYRVKLSAPLGNYLNEEFKVTT